MLYSFCPKCGGKLEAKSVREIDPERLVCGECSFIFFLDPKVSACTIFKVDGRIALLKRGIDPGYGKWVFPGGYLNRGEKVADAAIRETKEEANVDVKIISLLNVYSYNDHPVVIIVYAANIIDGTFEPHDESLEAGTFSPGEIPWTELAFPSTHDALKEYIRRFC